MAPAIRRKIMRLLFVLSCIWLLWCYANTEEIFLQGNAAYNKGDYTQAVQLYERIESKGPVIFYNMGHCFYHLGNYFQALLCWKKATLQGNFHLRAAAEHNCKRACEKLSLQVQEPSYLKSMVTWAQSYSLRLWQILFLCFWSIFLLLYIFWRTRKKMVICFFLLPVSLCGTGMWLTFLDKSQTRALVRQKEALLLAGTDALCTQRGKITEGQEVVVKEQRGQWCKVCINEYSGWVNAEALEFIQC